jgi:hypothetical protein
MSEGDQLPHSDRAEMVRNYIDHWEGILVFLTSWIYGL